MAHQRLNQEREARQWLARGEQWLEESRQNKPTKITEGDVPSWSKLPWDERLALEILHREAVALMRLHMR